MRKGLAWPNQPDTDNPAMTRQMHPRHQLPGAGEAGHWASPSKSHYRKLMKPNILNPALVCAVALTFAGCSTSRPSTAWDYKIIHGGISRNAMPPPLEPQLQQAVREGWEVVSSGGDGSIGFVILRKPQ
jgi:hypothetical protein